MALRDTPFVIVALLAAAAVTFALALTGEPQAVWLMRDVLGVF
jgi:hypothetical protein